MRLYLGSHERLRGIKEENVSGAESRAAFLNPISLLIP